MSGRQAEMTIIINAQPVSNFEIVSFSKKIATYELKIMDVL